PPPARSDARADALRPAAADRRIRGRPDARPLRPAARARGVRRGADRCDARDRRVVAGRAERGRSSSGGQRHVSLLRKRGMRPLLLAEVVSSLGSQMTFLALPWFVRVTTGPPAAGGACGSRAQRALPPVPWFVLVPTGSPTRMGVVLGVDLLPIAFFGIPS